MTPFQATSLQQQQQQNQHLQHQNQHQNQYQNQQQRLAAQIQAQHYQSGHEILTPEQLQQELLKAKLKEKKGPVYLPTQIPPSAPLGLTKRHTFENSEVEMAREDLYKICNPDINRPFSSVEDACDRLIPYHMVAEYELDEVEERGTDANLSASVSRVQAWNETLNSRSREYFAMIMKQVAMYNSIIKRRREGDMRGEERLLLEQYLLQEEKQKLMELRMHIEAKEKAEREAAEAKVKEAIAQAEKARAEAHARVIAQARAEAAKLEAQAKVDAIQAEMNACFQAGNSLDMEDQIQHGFDNEGNMYWVSSDGDEDGEGRHEVLWKDDGHQEEDDKGVETVEVMTNISMQDGWVDGNHLDLNSVGGIHR